MCCLISAYSTSADCMGNQHNVALFPLKSVNVDAGDVTFHTLLHRADVSSLSMLTQVMSPFTPFFTEQMYQNLRRCQPEGAAPESVHWCDFPPAQQPWKGDVQIQRSVARMQTVIELSRTIRYTHHHEIASG